MWQLTNKQNIRDFLVVHHGRLPCSNQEERDNPPPKKEAKGIDSVAKDTSHVCGVEVRDFLHLPPKKYQPCSDEEDEEDPEVAQQEIPKKKRREWRKGRTFMSVYKLNKGTKSRTFPNTYQCTHRTLQEERSVKILNRSDTEMDDHYLLEIAILKALDHPNLLRIHEVFETERHFSIVTDSVDHPNILEAALEMKEKFL